MKQLNSAIEQFCHGEPETLEQRKYQVVSRSLDGHLRALEKVRHQDIDYRLGTTVLSVVKYYSRLYEYDGVLARKNRAALRYIPGGAASDDATKLTFQRKPEDSSITRFADAKQQISPQDALWRGLSEEYEVLRQLHRLDTQKPKPVEGLAPPGFSPGVLTIRISQAAIETCAIPVSGEIKELAGYQRRHDLPTFLDYLVHARGQFVETTERIFAEKRLPGTSRPE